MKISKLRRCVKRMQGHLQNGRVKVSKNRCCLLLDKITEYLEFIGTALDFLDRISNREICFTLKVRSQYAISPTRPTAMTTTTFQGNSSSFKLCKNFIQMF